MVPSRFLSHGSQSFQKPSFPVIKDTYRWWLLSKSFKEQSSSFFAIECNGSNTIEAILQLVKLRYSIFVDVIEMK